MQCREFPICCYTRPPPEKKSRTWNGWDIHTRVLHAPHPPHPTQTIQNGAYRSGIPSLEAPMTRARACGARRARFRWFFGPVRRSRHPSPCGHLISILVRREPASTSRARASRAPGFALAPSCHRRAKTGLRVSRCVASRGRLAGAPLRASWRQNRTRFSSFLKRAHVVDRYFGAGVRAARAHLRSQPARGGVRFLASGRSSGHIRRFPRGTLVAALATGQSSSNSRDHWHSTDSRHSRAQSWKFTFRARNADPLLHLPSRPFSTSGCRFRSPRQGQALHWSHRGAEAGDPRGFRPLRH